MIGGVVNSPIDSYELDDMENRSLAASGRYWDVTQLEEGSLAVLVTFDDGSQDVITLKRDLQPASASDVEFVSAARRDVDRLVAAVRSNEALAIEELDEIERRCQGASPGPWRPFLEGDGGVGGTSVIWVSDSDDEPDLYLWLGGDLAPDADYEFTAAARQDVPRLLAALGRNV